MVIKVLPTAVIAFLFSLFAPNVYGLSGPSSDTDGNYTLTWTVTCGQWASYTLYENGSQIDSGACTTSGSYDVTGRLSDTYNYVLDRCYYNSSGFEPDFECLSDFGDEQTHTVVVSLPPPKPSSITTPSGTDTDGAYMVTWASSTDATSYLLQEQRDGGSWGSKYSGSGTGKSFSGQPNGSYRYRVRASNSSGTSSFRYSDTFSVLLPPTTPASINVPTTTDTDGSYTVSWSSSSTATSYLLQQQKNSGSWVTKYTGAGTSKSFSGQTNGSYRYRVRASNSSGNSSFKYSTTFSVLLPPPPPATITVPTTKVNKGMFTVSWSASVGATNYNLQESKDGNWSTAYSGAYVSELELTGREDGIYQYCVTASNASGQSDPPTCSATFEVERIPITLFEYDARGRLIRVEDDAGAEIDYQYDDAGNRLNVNESGGTN